MRSVLFVALFCAIAVTACHPTVADLLEHGQGSLLFNPIAPVDQLGDLVTAQNLNNLLNDSGQKFTLFAPSDWAFATDGFNKPSTGVVADILAYHLITGAKIMSGDLAASQIVNMTNGANTTITKGQGVRINNYANVIEADIQACNGVIHIIDHVLVPPYAPVRYNTLPTIAELAGETADLSTLLFLVTEAGLASVLSTNAGPGNDQSYTVFAPTNLAFEKANLTGTSAEIAAILEYHLLASRVLSTDLGASQTVSTLTGADLTIFQSDGNVIVQAANSVARVHTANIQASNGVVHLIDTVLLPPKAQKSEKPAVLLQQKLGKLRK